MSGAPAIKGYCPGALRPMMSGDGLVVRVRPFGGRLTPTQVRGIAALSETHGNGVLDLSSRGNIQIRGVTEANHPAVLDGLQALSLLDASPEVESRRNVLVTPFWQEGDQTQEIATALTEALMDDSAPALPHKFGFVVDTGPTPVLQHASADVRLEREPGGGLLVAADGAPVARPISDDVAVQEAIELARWFMETRGDERRMRALFQRTGVLPQDHFVPPARQSYQPIPGLTPQGMLVGLAFGQITAPQLADLADMGALRLTPWRMVLIEGLEALPATDGGLITAPNDPLLRVVACSGQPACAQAWAATRPIARALAPHVPNGKRLHVSGCAKGCAHPKPAALTVTATAEGFDLIREGRAGDTPEYTALSPDDIAKAI